MDAGSAADANEADTVLVAFATTIPAKGGLALLGCRMREWLWTPVFPRPILFWAGGARPPADWGEAYMMKRFALAALSALFLASISAVPASAQGTQPTTKPAATKPAPAKKATTKKPRSAKQLERDQKMKDCNVKWTASGQKGKAARSRFMSTCLKG